MRMSSAKHFSATTTSLGINRIIATIRSTKTVSGKPGAVHEWKNVLLNLIVERMISVPKYIAEAYKALLEQARRSFEERDAKES